MMNHVKSRHMLILLSQNEEKLWGKNSLLDNLMLYMVNNMIYNLNQNVIRVQRPFLTIKKTVTMI